MIIGHLLGGTMLGTLAAAAAFLMGFSAGGIFLTYALVGAAGTLAIAAIPMILSAMAGWDMRDAGIRDPAAMNTRSP